MRPHFELPAEGFDGGDERAEFDLVTLLEPGNRGLLDANLPGELNLGVSVEFPNAFEVQMTTPAFAGNQQLGQPLRGASARSEFRVHAVP